MKKPSWIKIICSVTLFLICSVPLFGGSIATTFVDVTLQNLSINKEYKLEQPLKVINRSDKPLNIVISVQILSEVSSRRLNADYQPIEHTNWLKVVPSTYTLPAGQTASSDVFLKIPKNRKLRGKSFQANLEITGYPTEKTGGVTFVPSLLTKLRFSIEKKKGFLFW
ncbi:MAG: hypothetical protein AB1349_05485 [Elusimicrobiota bacterium]